MKKIKIIFIILGVMLVIFVAIQVIPVSRTNPPVLAEPNWDSPQTRDLFYQACGDCHSNETEWPWYSYISPVSWLILNDVKRGRANFNVSETGSIAPGQGNEAAEVIQEGEMPPTTYLLMHALARLSPEEKAALIDGLMKTFQGK